MSLDDAPGGWTVWSEESDGRTVLAYRPDVFDGTDYPAECLPTIYVSDGARSRRPGAGQRRTDSWHATLFFEPAVEGPSASYESREAAVEGALDLARRFDAGEVDYRARYQVPRESYFARLDDLTGRDP
jgi:hypothetical protein